MSRSTKTLSWLTRSEGPNSQRTREEEGKLAVERAEQNFYFPRAQQYWSGGRSFWYLCHYWQLLGHHGLELGGGHGGSIICSLVKLCDQSVDGQLQL